MTSRTALAPMSRTATVSGAAAPGCWSMTWHSTRHGRARKPPVSPARSWHSPATRPGCRAWACRPGRRRWRRLESRRAEAVQSPVMPRFVHPAVGDYLPPWRPPRKRASRRCGRSRSRPGCPRSDRMPPRWCASSPSRQRPAASSRFGPGTAIPPSCSPARWLRTACCSRSSGTGIARPSRASRSSVPAFRAA